MSTPRTSAETLRWQELSELDRREVISGTPEFRTNTENQLYYYYPEDLSTFTETQRNVIKKTTSVYLTNHFGSPKNWPKFYQRHLVIPTQHPIALDHDHNITNLFAKTMGISVSAPLPTRFTAEQIECFNAVNPAIAPFLEAHHMAPHQMVCYYWALLELGAIDEFLSLYGNTHKKNPISILELLLEWGYALVPLDQLKENDLVVYYQGNQDLSHFGCYRHTNREVQSKWGAAPHIFTHPLAVVPGSYGNQIQFYRKNPDATPTYPYRDTILERMIEWDRTTRPAAPAS